jgi:hypothetical protein
MSVHAGRELPTRAELVCVLQEVRWVVEHAIGARTLELVESVAAGEQADSQRARTLCCKHVPNAVPDDERRSNVDAQTLGSRDEQIGVRLSKSHLIARDDRNVAEVDVNLCQGQACRLQSAAGGNCPGNSRRCQEGEKLCRAGQRANFVQAALVRFRVQPLQALDPCRLDLEAGFPQQHIGEQAAAHADPAMDAPDRKLYAFCDEGFVPRQDMLVDAVDQRAIEVEQKRSLQAHAGTAQKLRVA